jgi:hypothetical protein
MALSAELRHSRLARIHKRCLELSEKHPTTLHCALRSDDEACWRALSGNYLEGLPDLGFRISTEDDSQVQRSIKSARDRGASLASEYGVSWETHSLAGTIQTLVWELVAWRSLGVGPVPSYLSTAEFEFKNVRWTGVLITSRMQGHDLFHRDEEQFAEVAKAGLHESAAMVSRLFGRAVDVTLYHRPERLMWEWAITLYDILDPLAVQKGKFAFIKLPCNVFYATALAIEKLIGIDESPASAKSEPPQYVTLAEASALCHRPKKTLELWKQEGKLPPPAVKSRGRNPARWQWSALKPALESLTGLQLPKCPTEGTT